MWVFNGANLPYWILLGAGLVLFSTTIALGGGEDEGDLGGDADAGNGDIGADFDLDVDVDADVDFDGDAGDADGDGSEEAGSGTSFGALLAALGVGKAPLLILLAVDFSLWGFLGWVANVTVASALGRMPTAFLGLGGGVFLGSLVIALFLGSNIARAIGSVMKSFGEDSRADRLIGCIGTVSSAQMSKDRIAQVDVIDPADNRVTVSARLPDWARETPRRGSEVTIIDRQPDGYVAIANGGADRERWLG